ncbi:tetratricopeptide repeat protein [bacterium]|nr:tetratricopeptide repeat protein [bacterium]
MIKKIILIFFLTLIIQACAIAKDKDYIGLMKIDPEKNAYVHNNMGLQYLNIGQYYAAIQEFKIAIGLNPNTQATSLYFNNLGETYLRLGVYASAQDCFERAIEKYPLNFKYYLNLVTSYQMQGILDSKLKYYRKNKKSPLDDITIGLILIAKGQTNDGITVLDNFVMNEPKLFITDGVKYYLSGIIEAKKNGLR